MQKSKIVTPGLIFANHIRIPGAKSKTKIEKKRSSCGSGTRSKRYFSEALICDFTLQLHPGVYIRTSHPDIREFIDMHVPNAVWYNRSLAGEQEPEKCVRNATDLFEGKQAHGTLAHSISKTQKYSTWYFTMTSGVRQIEVK